MNITSFLQVIDDIEMLIANISYHRTIGVNNFLVADRGTSGEDRDRLMAVAEQENVRVFESDIADTPDRLHALADYRLRAYRRAFEEFDSDWCLFSDLDEFWAPRSGTLDSIGDAITSDVITVPRYNAVPKNQPLPDKSGRMLSHEEMLQQEVFAQPKPQNERIFLSIPDLRWIEYAVAPKFMSRVRDVRFVHQGFHGVDCDQEVRRSIATDLALVHFPFTTLEKFSAKVNTIRHHLEQTENSDQKFAAVHWRRWATLSDSDMVAAEYQSQHFPPERLADYRARRIVQTVGQVLESHDRDAP
ncbi:MAG: glycosyltransferase family 2 protein [Gammaproteobacteria bacterium]|nr:glycosyltransferase family 2 protein [Gammaproteobacteria bacterium]